jgi:hypothetical protein
VAGAVPPPTDGVETLAGSEKPESPPLPADATRYQYLVLAVRPVSVSGLVARTEVVPQTPGTPLASGARWTL